MSLRPTTARLTPRLLFRPQLRAPPPPRTTLLPQRHSSTDAPPPPPPPLLQKLKGDLKAAMRAKDAARLAVLRGAISAANNAAKTSAPVASDAALVALLRRQARSAAEAQAEAEAAGRDDLARKEQAQIAVLEEYVAQSGVACAGADELRTVVAGVVTALQAEGAAPDNRNAMFGSVMKKVTAPEGPLAGKEVDKAELARVVKEVVGA
ncbi:GatB/YqeY domain-containing protein [Xylariomycetidae sp. FL0641]|nr:GatB/YqeY domain-containing protein [Xylariomycetidae sp. FL0641]